MNRLIGAALAAVVLVLGLPSPSPAEPPAAGCGVPDPRITVPAGFALDVCTEGHRLTLVNRETRPVRVRTSGDVGQPVAVRAEDGVPAAVLRAFPEGRVLMPGDSAQWSFGAGAGQLVVSGDHGDAVTAALAPYLTGQEDRFPYVTVAAFGALVRSAVSAVDARTACVAAGPNFLGATACDVAAATAIGRALHTRFPASVAAQLAGVMLDPARWSTWAAAASAADRALPGDQVLRIAVRPGAVPPPAPSPATRAARPRTALSPAAHPAAPPPAPATPAATAPPAAPPPAVPAAPAPVPSGWPPQWPVPWPLPWPIPLPQLPSGVGDHDHAHNDGHEHDRWHGDEEAHGR